VSSGRRPGRPRGPQQDPAERRAALLGAAEDAIRDHGPDVSMEQIADRAGVSKATLYDNFDGKLGLTQALLQRYGTRLLHRFADAIAGPVRPRQVVTGGLATFVRFIAEDPDIYRFIVRHASGDDLADEIARPIAALLRSLEVAEPEALAHATLGTIVSATQWWSGRADADLDGFLTQLTTYVWGGLAAAGVVDDRPLDTAGLAAVLDAATADQRA
jgi:AcrR family transcriptional regulator